MTETPVELTGREARMQSLPVVWLGALVCCTLWGSAVPGIKIGYGLFAIAAEETAAQILFAGLRFTFAGLLGILLGSFLHGHFLVPRRSAWGKIGILSIFQTIVQYLLFYIGLAHTTGTKTAVIAAVSVFLTVLLSSLVFRLEHLTARKILGCLLGFSGVVLINLSGLNFSFTLLGEGCILGSNVAYSFSTVLLKRFSDKEDPVMLSAWQFLLGGLVLTAAGAASGGRLTQISPAGVGMLLYLAAVSAVAYSLWGILLRYNPVSRVSVFGFMTPLMGFLLSALLLRESQSVGLMSLAALTLVCAGIFVVNRPASGSD